MTMKQQQNKKIGVLIADDSFFMRRLIREIVSQDDGIEVVGEAKDGTEVLNFVLRLRPDVVTMDFNMPKMNGAEATRQIMLLGEPLPAVVMVSAYTKEGAAETLQSLRAGAVDFVAKPSGELSLDIKKVSEEILCKIRTASRAHIRTFGKIGAVKHSETAPMRLPKTIVVIGASTGGPPVVEDLLHRLPADLGAAVVVVQHMPKFFTESFARRLDEVSALPAHEIIAGEEIKSGVIYLSPGNFHASLKKSVEENEETSLFFSLRREKPHSGLSSIDSVMTSVAKQFYGRVIAVILTGMGSDGLEGVAALKAGGAYVIAQDPETAAVDSMPSAVIDARLSDVVLSPEKISAKIIELCQ